MECKAFVNRGESKFESSKQMLKVKNFYIEEKKMLDIKKRQKINFHLLAPNFVGLKVIFSNNHKSFML